MSQTEDHKFRAPFRTIEEGESVRVVDASGMPICYIYFEDEASRALITNRMNRKQALAIASKIAQLPDLLKQE